MYELDGTRAGSHLNSIVIFHRFNGLYLMIQYPQFHLIQFQDGFMDNIIQTTHLHLNGQ